MNTEPVCRRLPNPNYLRNTLTHATVQAQTHERGAWVFLVVRQCRTIWYVPTHKSFIDDSVLYTAYNTVTVWFSTGSRTGILQHRSGSVAGADSALFSLVKRNMPTHHDAFNRVQLALLTLFCAETNTRTIPYFMRSQA